MKAIIIGGGIGGLAAAVGLQQIGCEVEVFERAVEFSDVGAGLSIWSNGMYALDQLGVADALLASGVHTLDFCDVRDHQGKQLKRIDWTRTRSTTGFPTVAVYRPRLIDALLAPIESQVRTNAECCCIDVNGKSVRVEFTDGRETEGDFVVVADGIRSFGRRWLQPAVIPKFAGYIAFQSVIDLSATDAGSETWQFTLGRGGQFGFVPLNDRQLYWFGTKNVVNSARPQDAHAEAIRHFRDWHGAIPRIVANTPSANLVCTPVFDLPPLKSWGRGQVTLLGDAAHAMTPNLGQGACQALEDAVVLAQCVQRLHEDGRNVTGALRTFEEIRRPYVARVSRDARLAGRLMQTENALLRKFCQTYMRLLAGSFLDAGIKYASHRNEATTGKAP